MLEVNRLIWDDWNRQHISTKHEVSQEEVEQVCSEDVIVQQGDNGRLILVGLTQRGRMLRVVLHPKEEAGSYYVVTAFPATKKDRILYQQEKGSEAA